MCFKDSVVRKILDFVEKCNKREDNVIHCPCIFLLFMQQPAMLKNFWVCDIGQYV